MTDHLEVWHCPECGGQHFYWHFQAPDGWGLVAEFAALPDMSSLEAAKAKALAADADDYARRAEERS